MGVSRATVQQRDDGTFMSNPSNQAQGRIGAVLEMHQAGYWPRKIVREMTEGGRPISRNAVLNILRRMGLAPHRMVDEEQVALRNDEVRSRTERGETTVHIAKAMNLPLN